MSLEGLSQLVFLTKTKTKVDKDQGRIQGGFDRMPGTNQTLFFVLLLMF